MEDRYVLLLQRVLDENKRLRETIEARDNEQKRVLEELSSKFESNSCSTPARTTGKKRKRTIAVSPQCRVSVYSRHFVIHSSMLSGETVQCCCI